ncbi:hypothetical protein [Campylobacter ureolyticus]|uniref:Uncharacterized protein n=1 Tax=Campylobacter ureolyticus TaxID=827 RepID=A0A9Q4PT35_9BACT|nr:hypothetical protein [Campylobacter ureolyticus]MCZ6160657.1 hypothetical protein [Campylobacter ureolyticus]MCZ6161044.1 hypothetical protein [Campylobacter ureolyticus]MCZ6164394.1 hypothetical protein [Campylobacter ureolyticus]MCZ6166237.1 hypothetical protein [Campylobacter ureolyticus]MCZ6168016.1 hypothetical protein [Campylobacter ureolyticus]
MALPLVGALPGVITAIATGISFIYRFIKSGALWFLTKIATYWAIAWVNGFIAFFVVLYYGSVIKILLEAYGFIDDFIEILSFKNTNSEVVNFTRDIFGSALFFQALNDVINLFKPIISLVFVTVGYAIGTKFFLSLRSSILSIIIAKI